MKSIPLQALPPSLRRAVVAADRANRAAPPPRTVAVAAPPPHRTARTTPAAVAVPALVDPPAVPPPAGRDRPRTVAWKDVPAGWGQCRDHGAAWWPQSVPCPFCAPELGPDHEGPAPEGEELEGRPGPVVPAEQTLTGEGVP